MKLSNIKYPVLLLTAGLLFGSCKKYLDINTTPNNPTFIIPSVLLPETIVGMAWSNGNDLNRATSALVQHIAGVGNQTQSYDVFNFSGAFDNQWNGELYNGCIANTVLLRDMDSATNPIYAGIAKIEMAYSFSLIIDVWGDAPYSQAGMGLKYTTPRFDKVQDIYQGNAGQGITSLFDLVKSGMADLDKPNNVFKPSKDDIVYGGDITKWKRFANSLMLKFAIQMSNVNPALAKSTIQGLIDGNNYINANSLDFDVPFGSSVNNQNPIYAFNYVNRLSDQMMSLRLLNLMRGLNDTVRLSKLFTKPNGVFTAFDNGSTVTAPVTANRSQYGAYFVGNSGNAPLHLLTYAQVNFILAESAVVLGTTGDANTYYQNGIKAHMQKIGMTDAEIANYFATNPTVVNLTGTTEDMRKQIITQ
ncbi:MAG TPA: SusD/RagB family nutrient-binding outer membrane lipoprotein, partial [Puia sp.]